MRCEEFRTLAEAYLDGEVEDRTVEEVTRHFESCERCAKFGRALEQEDLLYHRYDCDAEPSPVFWRNIESQIQSTGPSARPTRTSIPGNWLTQSLAMLRALRLSPLMAASLVLIAVGVTVLVMNRSDNTEKGSTPAQLVAKEPAQVEEIKSSTGPVPGPSPVQSLPAPTSISRRDKPASTRTISVRRQDRSPEALVREAEQNYRAAIAMLSRDLRRRSRLDEETTARFERTLAEIDRNIVDTRRTMRRHPGDPIAARYMLTAYARKVDVLREMISY